MSQNILEKQKMNKKDYFSQFCFHHSKNNITIQICIDKSIKTLHDMFDKMSGVSEDLLENLFEFSILFFLCFIALEIGKLFTCI